MPYYQQVWALSECSALVKEYEKKLNIRFEFLIRARPHSVLALVNQTLEPLNNLTIAIPDQHNFGGYNDRFAIGSMSMMGKYMSRWHNFSACYIKNIHAESFLKLFLDRFHSNVTLIKRLTYEHLPHGFGHCH
ncbi:unnamed protein product [Rotaria socialis]|uniref:DUF7796 domain-containing protein n=1 Tax=Rotaria socialis TaxID=392032 RepID=A0A820KGN5_9BILA|nr:unnamed protein product [Rotaria socialis]CAF3386774.1 unnamed protein product [Rotaria socialis]CAF3416651.1 unnamed protein product [Rotaria socialis]CAF4343943.1 unnamed protein product [Rotaria socialis]CAF4400232.1 unnamed protein product [Rotaria socialis]